MNKQVICASSEKNELCGKFIVLCRMPVILMDKKESKNCGYWKEKYGCWWVCSPDDLKSVVKP